MEKHIKNAGKFYALTVMILAIVATVAFLSAQDKAKKLAEANISTTAKPKMQQTQPERHTLVNEAVTGVKDERYNESKAAEESTQPAEPAMSRADSFVMPLSHGFLKDYSDGELVLSKTMGDWRAHTGVDFSGEADEKVRAINNGVVISVTNDALWGTVVEIDHLDGMVARYCGLNGDDPVKEGTKVSAGDIIGSLGNLPIESADGTHLHLEIKLDGVYVDPIEAMGKSRDDLD